MTEAPVLPRAGASLSSVGFGRPTVPWPLAVGELDASTPWFEVELRCSQSV
jgi:hypothetical protein